MKRMLVQRSTLYKTVGSDVIEELVKLANVYGVDGKKIVTMFDKFMTVSR